MSLDWILQAGHKIGDGVTAFAQARLQQRFVAEEGDSAFRFQDVQAGVNYIHRVDLVDVGIDRKISFFHRVAARFPTSRASQNQALILAPTRELANQIAKEIQDLAQGTNIGVTSIIGGESIWKWKSDAPIFRARSR